jgi:hypothetical protein
MTSMMPSSIAAGSLVLSSRVLTPIRFSAASFSPWRAPVAATLQTAAEIQITDGDLACSGHKRAARGTFKHRTADSHKRKSVGSQLRATSTSRLVCRTVGPNGSDPTMSVRVLRRERTEGSRCARSKRQDAAAWHLEPFMVTGRAHVTNHPEVWTLPNRDGLSVTRTLWARDLVTVRRRRKNRHGGAKHGESLRVAQYRSRYSGLLLQNAKEFLMGSPEVAGNR